MYNLDEKLTFSTKINLKVDIKTENLGMHILGRDKEETELIIKLKTEKDIDLEDILEQNFDSDENKLYLSLSEPDENINFIPIAINLFIPKQTKINIQTENGRFKINEIKGDVNSRSENGKISFKKILGNITADSENGKLSINDCKGKLQINTENGPIKLKNISGDIIIEGENGQLKCYYCKGTIDVGLENGEVKILDAKFQKANVKNENGSIYYKFQSLKEGEFNFKNQNGKIHLIIPEDIPYSIIAKNQIGRFHIGLDGEYNRKKENGTQILEMTKDSGNVRIKAENQNGMIALENKKRSKKGFSAQINMEKIAESLDKIADMIPGEMKKKEIRKKIAKAQKKLRKINIDIPDVSEIVRKATENINKEIDISFDDDNKKDLGKKIKSKVKEALKNVIKNAKKEKEQNSKYGDVKENNNNKKEKRFKILKLLQEGKINVEEAEQLLNTIGDKNE